jgi:hypothetical protein
MEKEFIPYDKALALKELGFDEPCLAVYQDPKFMLIDKLLDNGWVPKELLKVTNTIYASNGFVTAPLYQQAFRWFRENYNINVSITSKTLSDGKTVYISHGRTIPDTINKGLIVDILPYRTDEIYEKAELECLKKLIEIVKNKN